MLRVSCCEGRRRMGHGSAGEGFHVVHGQHAVKIQQDHEFVAYSTHAGDQIRAHGSAEARRRLDIGGRDLEHLLFIPQT